MGLNNAKIEIDLQYYLVYNINRFIFAENLINNTYKKKQFYHGRKKLK